MSNNKYWNYFKYVVEHKHNVFIECINMSKQLKEKNKRDLIIHAFTHDLSKFIPNKEFYAYADWFYGEYGSKYKGEFSDKHEICKRRFENAWKHHYENNSHHWNYWTSNNSRIYYILKNRGMSVLDMPSKHIRFMICNWKAMSRKFGDTAQEFYLKNYDKIKLGKETRRILEAYLDLCFKHCCECDEVYWMTIREVIENSINYKKENPNSYSDRNIKKWIEGINKKYNLDMLELLGHDRKDVYNK